jgi:hypothetical protein
LGFLQTAFSREEMDSFLGERRGRRRHSRTKCVNNSQNSLPGAVSASRKASRRLPRSPRAPVHAGLLKFYKCRYRAVAKGPTLPAPPRRSALRSGVVPASTPSPACVFSFPFTGTSQKRLGRATGRSARALKRSPHSLLTRKFQSPAALNFFRVFRVCSIILPCALYSDFEIFQYFACA